MICVVLMRQFQALCSGKSYPLDVEVEFDAQSRGSLTSPGPEMKTIRLMSMTNKRTTYLHTLDLPTHYCNASIISESRFPLLSRLNPRLFVKCAAPVADHANPPR